MEDGRPTLAPRSRPRSSLRLSAPARAPNTPRIFGPSAGRPNRRRASAARHRTRALGDRPADDPVLRRPRARRSYERKTRSANGAASRLARPRCASASVSAVGSASSPPRAPSARRRSLRRRGRRPAAAASRIRRLSRTAPPARTSDRTSSTPGLPRQPRDAEGVELEPRFRHEARLNAIRRPCERHGRSAIAQRLRRLRLPGSTCPAVPPAAIRHLSPGCSAIVARDVKEDAHAGEADDEARPAVRHERQRDPGQRRDAQHGRDVDRPPGRRRAS